MSNDSININVIVADRPYRLRAKKHEEENVRKAARLIKEKLREYQSAYDAKDKQDYLAMIALMFAVDTLNYKDQNQELDATFKEKLTELDAILTEFLGK